MQVKELVPGGVAARHGGIRRGDCILSVNRLSLSGLSITEALTVLKQAGDNVTLVISRVAENWTSCPRIPHSPDNNSNKGPMHGTPLKSPAARDSNVGGSRTLELQADTEIHREVSQHSESKPISVHYSNVESWRMSLQWSSQNIHSEEISDEGTPRPRKRMALSLQRRTKFKTRNPQGKLMTFTDPDSTLPRKISGSKVGVYLVELQKKHGGWLGLQLNGSKESPPTFPITVRTVLRGGVAYKSGLISEEDEVIEVNGVSFEKLTVVEAVKNLRDLPPGQVTMIMRDQRKSRDLNACRKRLFLGDNEVQVQ